jgi:hypothetical protein
MIREADEDTVLQVPNPPEQGGVTPLPIPKGVQVCMNHNTFYCSRLIFSFT